MATSPENSSFADTVYSNARVLTVDADFTICSHLAVRDGNIAAVGGAQDVASLIGPETEVIDLEGHTLLPGINDSHLHAFAYGLDTPPFSLDLSYPQVQSLADIREAVRAAAAEAPAGTWIIGTGWDAGYLEECKDSGREPHRNDIDDASPEHPVFLQDYSRHTSWVNSHALKLAGVDATTQSPEGGIVEKDPDGLPTGVLKEGAQGLVQSKLPKLDNPRREQAVRSTITQLQRLGITSYTEPGLGPGGEATAGGAMGTGGLEVYADLAKRSELGIRVSALALPTGLSGSHAELRENLSSMEIPESSDPRMFRVLGTKVFADGIPPGKTAWMHDEYVGGGCGSLCVIGNTDEERVAEVAGIIKAGHDAGYQVGVHVTGDRAIDVVIDALEAAMTENPREDPRHYLIHGDFVSEEALARLATLGVGVNMNPIIKWTIADLEVGVVGPERAAYEWPYRTAIASGVKVMSSSDAPVTAPEWRQGLSTMLLRESKASGAVSGPDQTIRLEQAIRTYTSNPAWQDFAEDWKGTLEPGKVADLCILEGDLVEIDPREIPNMPVVLTVLGGQTVYDARS
ncbi:amidohydrolase [Arthrobacter sp. NPDC080031]|uniref:amidohydrolase n=1 Tax=Arthrobacter sp. NPDC080031 TaxID=3155918 RepID=UPI00344CF3F3